MVEDKEQVNALSSDDLKQLFKFRTNTPSDTHDKLKCKFCRLTNEAETDSGVLTEDAKLFLAEMLEWMCSLPEAVPFTGQTADCPQPEIVAASASDGSESVVAIAEASESNVVAPKQKVKSGGLLSLRSKLQSDGYTQLNE